MERQQADSRQTDVRTNRQTDTYRMEDRGTDKHMDGWTHSQTNYLGIIVENSVASICPVFLALVTSSHISACIPTRIKNAIHLE